MQKYAINHNVILNDDSIVHINACYIHKNQTWYWVKDWSGHLATIHETEIFCYEPIKKGRGSEP